MELELHKTYMTYYDTVLNTTLCHEETMEAIVPDACPDILKIVDCEAVAYLKEKEVQEGRVQLTGAVQATLLYLPDGAEGLRRMEVRLPFSYSADASEIRSGCMAEICPRIRSADARSLNPRKVLVRADLVIEVRVYARQKEQLCDQVICTAEQGVQQRFDTEQCYPVTAVEEKPFSFTEDVTFSGSRPRMEELLKVRTELRCNDSKTIGTKLIFKGDVHLLLLYRDMSQAIATASFDLPFSQIVEVAELGDSSHCHLDIQMTDCACVPSLSSGESGVVSVACSLLAQVVVRETRSVSLLADAYSTSCQLVPEYKTHSFPKLVEGNSRQITVRSLLECPQPVKDVLDIYVSLGEVKPGRDGTKEGLLAESLVTVLYLGEDGEVGTIQQAIAVHCPVEMPSTSHVLCHCGCGSECYATPSSAGVEVRYGVEFDYMALMTGHTQGVCGLRLEEDEQAVSQPRASIVLRMVGDGERLWDLAKAYCTTTGDILQANALEGDYLPKGQLLLIPKKR